MTGTKAKEKGSDIDDDIIDRVVGKEVKKPGADQGKSKDIVVDASNLPKATASSSGSGSGEKKKEMSNKSSSSSSSSSEEKDSGKKKGGKKSDNPMDGLEL